MSAETQAGTCSKSLAATVTMSPSCSASVASSPSSASTCPVCPSYSPPLKRTRAPTAGSEHGGAPTAFSSPGVSCSSSTPAGSLVASLRRDAIFSRSQPASRRAGNALPPGLRTCSAGRAAGTPSAASPSAVPPLPALAGSPRRVSRCEPCRAASMAPSSSTPMSTTRGQPRINEASSQPSGSAEILAWKKSSWLRFASEK
mmetsp:Transcript_25553/g.79695  ORF Transcript_25553/g.79695 Transcript_25553/m.79695 type:complete len:201 (-) Transcript_25553:263-865(-)